jgi:hypothetical protein
LEQLLSRQLSSVRSRRSSWSAWQASVGASLKEETEQQRQKMHQQLTVTAKVLLYPSRRLAPPQVAVSLLGSQPLLLEPRPRAMLMPRMSAPELAARARAVP